METRLGGSNDLEAKGAETKQERYETRVRELR